MKKEVYSYESLINELNSTDSIILISGYYSDSNTRINLMYYKGIFCINKGFNLNANFTMHKIGNATVKAHFKKCGAFLIQNLNIDSEPVRKAYCYDNFIRNKSNLK